MADYLDFPSLQRPKSPNTFLLAPDGLYQHVHADMPAPVFDLSPGDLHTRCLNLIKGHKRWTVAQQDADSGRIRFIAVSGLMRYKDDVDILVLPEAADNSSGDNGLKERSTLAIYSRSRVGYSDMGANAKRVRGLIEQLSSTL